MTRDEWLRAEIDGFRKKIETYQAFIAEYEQQLGLTPQSSSQAGQSSGSTKRTDMTIGDDPLAWITGMIFFNKSQPEAAKMVLERVGYPLKTEQLMEAVQKGGVTIGGKTEAAKKQNFYTILNRNADLQEGQGHAGDRGEESERGRHLAMDGTRRGLEANCLLASWSARFGDGLRFHGRPCRAASRTACKSQRTA